VTSVSLSSDLELLAGTQMEHAVQRVDELGRLLGAWKKGTDRKAVRFLDRLAVQRPFCLPQRVLAGLPNQPYRFPCCQDSVAVRHLAVLPFAV